MRGIAFIVDLASVILRSLGDITRALWSRVGSMLATGSLRLRASLVMAVSTVVTVLIMSALRSDRGAVLTWRPHEYSTFDEQEQHQPFSVTIRDELFGDEETVLEALRRAGRIFPGAPDSARVDANVGMWEEERNEGGATSAAASARGDAIARERLVFYGTSREQIEEAVHRGKFLSYQPTGNGFNNQRLALEFAVAAAHLLARTLVVHPLSAHNASVYMRLATGDRLSHHGYEAYNNMTLFEPTQAFEPQPGDATPAAASVGAGETGELEDGKESDDGGNEDEDEDILAFGKSLLTKLAASLTGGGRGRGPGPGHGDGTDAGGDASTAARAAAMFESLRRDALVPISSVFDLALLAQETRSPILEVRMTHPEFRRTFASMSWLPVCHSPGAGYWSYLPAPAGAATATAALGAATEAGGGKQDEGANSESASTWRRQKFSPATPGSAWHGRCARAAGEPRAYAGGRGAKFRVSALGAAATADDARRRGGRPHFRVFVPTSADDQGEDSDADSGGGRGAATATAAAAVSPGSGGDAVAANTPAGALVLSLRDELGSARENMVYFERGTIFTHMRLQQLEQVRELQHLLYGRGKLPAPDPSSAAVAAAATAATAARHDLTSVFAREGALHFVPLFHQIAEAVVEAIRTRAATAGCAAAAGGGAAACPERRDRDREFSCVHVRHTDNELGAEPTVEHWARLVDEARVLERARHLYVATDVSVQERAFFAPLAAAGFQLHFLDQYEDVIAEVLARNEAAPFPDAIMEDVRGCWEQLVCARAAVFVGTGSSTFTTIIKRLRGEEKVRDGAVISKAVVRWMGHTTMPAKELELLLLAKD